MSTRSRLDRLAARLAAPRPVVDPELRALAADLGVYLAPDDELRDLHWTQPTDAEMREAADALGVDLGDA